MKASYRIVVAKADLVEAIGVARTRATLRRRGGIKLEWDTVLTATGTGLSIRSSDAAMDVPAEGIWASPVIVNGAAIRRLAPKLAGKSVTMTYISGRLFLNSTSIPAREA